ncbi:MAG: hypothetical protein J7M05_05915 [Anaerolineae bacterium]|nr:hypothetical protein [Anaerolineae bacterium]
MGALCGAFFYYIDRLTPHATVLNQFVMAFALGVIYKYTGNVIGPMLAWTLLNGQVWFVARLLAENKWP